MTAPAQKRGETIADALTALAASDPGRLALAVARGGSRYEEVSAGELARDAQTWAEIFAHRGIRKGTRTVVMISPGREFCGAVFGLLKLGAPPVFVDPGMGLANVGRAIRRTMPGAFVGIRKAQMARRVLRWGRDSISISVTVPSRNLQRAVLVNEGPLLDDIAAIAFTSGSTGPPKGVVFNHRNLLAQAELVRDLLGSCAQEPHLATFPLLMIFAPVLGLTAVLPEMDTTRPAAADPPRLIAASDAYRCRTLFASPVLVRKLGRYCRETGRTLSSIQRVFSAGAESDPDALAALEAAIAPGGEVFTPYGATEALPVSNLGSREILSETRQKSKQGAGVCVGRPLRGLTVDVIPISDRPIESWAGVSTLPAGEIGEITVSGDVVSREYFNNPEANGQAKIPGPGRIYHRMGDLGYLDDSGRLWMCGRKSQRVVTPGRVYFTVPVEGVFNTHPEVERTALVGVGAEGSVPALCVELCKRQSGREKSRISSELRALGAGYEHTSDIHHFLYHDSFPVDARHNSKIRREALAVWARRKWEEKQ